MISEIKNIEYNEDKKKWNIWVIKNTGSLDTIGFTTKKEAYFFKRGFELIKNGLETIEEKFSFFEKTQLTEGIKKKIVNLGRISKFIDTIISQNEVIIKEKLELYLKDYNYFIEIKLKVLINNDE